MTSERLFNSFIHPEKLLYPQKQIYGYAPAIHLLTGDMGKFWGD